jgi:hypothetical protein
MKSLMGAFHCGRFQYQLDVVGERKHEVNLGIIFWGGGGG